MEWLRGLLIQPTFLTAWLIVVLASLLVLARDLSLRNRQISALMKWVWAFAVAYSGPFGLGVYFYSGRRQVVHDSLWRRAFRSVAHCYSGCGAGEIVGVLIAAGLLSLGTWWVTVITFVLAYVAGFAFTVGPMVQEGVGLGQALLDAFYSETASITVMEVAAIGVDLWLGRGATVAEPLFWSALVVSLNAGLVAAYPVNVVLIAFGVKEGMHSPREMAQHQF